MGVTTFTEEYTSTIPPARLFKASILDAHNLIPKLFPQAIKSIDIMQGNGGAGSIRQINFAEGRSFKCVKHRIDELNEETYTYKYTLIEGDTLMGNQFESISHEVKFEQCPSGGTIAKMTSTCYSKDEFVLTQDVIEAGKGKALGLHKVVEDYLLQNPDAYA